MKTKNHKKTAAALATSTAAAVLLVGCSRTNKSIDTAPAAPATAVAAPAVTEAPATAAPAPTEPVAQKTEATATEAAVMTTDTTVAAESLPALAATDTAAPDSAPSANKTTADEATSNANATPNTNSGSADAAQALTGNASVDVNAIPKLKNEVGALRDATVKTCAKDGSGWKADGVVNNGGTTPAAYVITVSFLDDKNTTMGLNWSKVDKVAAGAAADWSLKAPATGDKLQCILRVTRGDA